MWRSLQTYDLARSTMTIERYAFSCMKNQVKDLLKRRRRREVFFADLGDGAYYEPAVTADSVYAAAEAELPVIPCTLTQLERDVIVRLYAEISQKETAVLLGLSWRDLERAVKVDHRSRWPSGTPTMPFRHARTLEKVKQRDGWEDVEYDPLDMRVLRVPLHGHHGSVRAWARVDEMDALIVCLHRWHLDGYGYAIAHVGKARSRRTVLMHRLILDAPVGLCVDHRNRVKLDNRRRNLRLVTHAENMMNVGANRGSSSAHRGVSCDTRQGKWVASFRGHYLGSFGDELEAAAYAEAARQRRDAAS